MSVDAAAPPILTVEVWFDVMCPFCYVGLTALDRALERFERAAEVRIEHRSFQLLPELPTDASMSLEEHFRQQHGVDAAGAEAMGAQTAQLGRSAGLDLRPEAIIVTNTRAAHRLIHLARERDRRAELVRRLFGGYFTEGRHLGSHEELAALAADVGLDAAEAIAALRDGAFDDEVTADVRRGLELGLTGVPFVVLDGRFRLVGAQPMAIYLRALQAAHADLQAGDPRVGS